MERISQAPDLKSTTAQTLIVIPTHVEKPQYIGQAVKNKKAREVGVYCNHYNVKFQKGKIYQWHAKFNPELPEDSRGLIDQIFQANTRSILTSLGKFVRASNCLFTFNLPVDKEDVKIFTFGDHSEF